MKPPLREPHFEITMEVRDHELDRFGVVNNAVYQNYLEHARHAFLASRGISLTHLLEEKFRPVITRIDLEYLLPLQSGDSFSVQLWLTRFTRAHVIGTFLGPNDRPVMPENMKTLHP